jgi:ribonuclease HI
LLSSGGIYLGDATNNVVEYSAVIELLRDATNFFAEYSAVIELLRDALSHGISYLWVYLDAQLVVS